MMKSNEGDFLHGIQNASIEFGLGGRVVFISGMKGADGVKDDGDGLDDIDTSLEPIRVFGLQQIKLPNLFLNLPLVNEIEIAEWISGNDLSHVFVDTGDGHIGLDVENFSMCVMFLCVCVLEV